MLSLILSLVLYLRAVYAHMQSKILRPINSLQQQQQAKPGL